MREHCQKLEEDIETLQMFEQSFLESQNEMKAKEKELAKAQEDIQKLIPLRQINDELKGDIRTLQITGEEKEFKVKALTEDLRIAER